ncbi:MAG: choice-of-anchor Q domain-containing protein [Myxococcota bacterium]
MKQAGLLPIGICAAALLLGTAAEAQLTPLFRHIGDVDPTAAAMPWAIDPIDQGTVPGPLDAGLSAIEVGPLSPDPGCAGCGIAAWGIDDRSGAAQSRYRYVQSPSVSDVADGRASGWTLRADVRVATDADAQAGLADPVDSGISVVYDEGPAGAGERFVLHLGADADGDPIARFGNVPITSEGVGNSAFVRYEIVYTPSGLAHLFIDGVRVANNAFFFDSGSGSPTQFGFGSGEAGAQGRGHFARVEWAIGMPECFNGIDDDGDGLMDESDPSCDGKILGSERAGTACDDDLDNDGDGFADLADPSCQGNLEGESEQLGTECDDGLDNDGDGWTDFREDPSCANDPAGIERLGTVCDDGIDDDADGTIDLRDPGCLFDPTRASEAGELVVDSEASDSDLLAGDGLCQTASLACTLQAAIEEANALAGVQGIRLPAGSYSPQPDAAFAVADPLVLIAPAGAAQTVIQGNGSCALSAGFDAELTVVGVTVRGHPTLPGGCGMDSSSNTRLIDTWVRDHRDASYSLWIDRADLFMMDSVVLNNTTSSFFAGGIHVEGGALTLIRGLVLGNSTTSEGGGIAFEETALLIDSRVSGNSATGGGGGIRQLAGTSASGGAVTLVRSLIENNHSANSGGGVWLDRLGPHAIVNSTISGNTDASSSALFGVGVHMPLGAVTRIQNSTIVGNYSTTSLLPPNLAGAAQLLGSIVASAGTGAPNCAAAVTSLGSNVSDDGSCFPSDAGSGDQASVDPMITPRIGGIGHFPLAGSPVIDAGDDTTCPPVDQLGTGRPIDGDGDSTARCDVGAIELPEPAFAAGLFLALLHLRGLGRIREITSR